MQKSFVGLVGLSIFAFGIFSTYGPSEAATTKSLDTTTSIKAAKWNPTVKLSYSKTSITLQPNGIPNHPRAAYYAVPNAGVTVPDASTAQIIKDPTKEQSYKFTIPTSPKYVSVTTAAPLGSIGVMISGAVLYNPYEGDGKTVAMANNFTITNANGITASFIDSCSGHPTPQQGAYHYHGLSSCVTAMVDSQGKPSHIIGYALDGFPIYGDRDSKGRKITASKLDQCNGINSATPEFPKGIYHYVLLATADVHSSITCFHGQVDASQIQAMPPMGDGGQMPKPDLAAAAKTLGITVDALRAALGMSMPPDLAAAASKLGISEATLSSALGLGPRP